MTARITVICGYGVTLEEVQQQYVEGVLAVLHREQPDLIVLTGGQTGEGTLSEAEFLQEHIQLAPPVETRLEKRSASTVDNILNAAAMVSAPNGVGVTVVCDQVHATVARMAARKAFRGVAVRVVVVYRAVDVWTYAAQLVNIPLSMLALSSPSFRRIVDAVKLAFRRRRRRPHP